MSLEVEVAPYFRLRSGQTRRILSQIRAVVSTWETLARERGCASGEIERMRSAFQVG